MSWSPRAHRTPHPTRTGRGLALALAAVGVTISGIGLAVPASAAGAWNDGRSDQDSLVDCITQSQSTGVSANVGWRTTSGKVPRVGERFSLRMYAGLVSLPCSGKAAVVPEIVLPQGVVFDGDEQDVSWSLGKVDQPQSFSNRDLGFVRGTYGGLLIGSTREDPTGGPFYLRQGEVLEIHVPVKATRPLKGPATARPECQDRREGRAPCPVAQAGDHVQVAFATGGYTSAKNVVVPYVGLFAANAAATPRPAPRPVVRAASSVRAKVEVSSHKKGVAAVTVRSSNPVAGRIIVRKGNRVLGTKTLHAGSSKVRIKLSRLKRGKHRITVSYSGSSRVRASSVTVTSRAR